MQLDSNRVVLDTSQLEWVRARKRKMSVVRAPSGELAPREGIAYANKASFYMCNLTLVLGSLYREYSILEQIGGRMY